MASDDTPSNLERSIPLTVKEAYAVGRHRGPAKISSDLLLELGLASGDVVELQGGGGPMPEWMSFIQQTTRKGLSVRRNPQDKCPHWLGRKNQRGACQKGRQQFWRYHLHNGRPQRSAHIYLSQSFLKGAV